MDEILQLFTEDELSSIYNGIGADKDIPFLINLLENKEYNPLADHKFRNLLPKLKNLTDKQIEILREESIRRLEKEM